MTSDHGAAEPTAQAAARPTLRRPLPEDMIRRDGCPFDPPSGLDRVREQGPVARTVLRNGAEVWMVGGYEEARAVFSDQRFSSDKFRHRDALQLAPEQVADARALAAPTRTPATDPDGRQDAMFIFMDPPEHSRLRRLLVGQFTVRRLRALEDRIREICVEHLEAMRAAGSSGDLVSAFALPVPSLVICELLGVPYADRAEFQARAALMLNLHTDDDTRQRVGASFNEYMHRLVAQKRAHPTDDLLSGLIHGDADPALTDRELVDIGTILLTAGHETTANMLALGTFALLEHPEQLAALRDDPTLIDGAVEELLRYLSVLHLGLTRVATEDLEVGDVTIPAGDTVLVSVLEANRDPRQWDQPADLDLHRPHHPHVAFGHGVHQCLGQQLARIEMRVGLTEMLDRLPGLRLAVPADEVRLRTDMVVFGVHALPLAWG